MTAIKDFKKDRPYVTKITNKYGSVKTIRFKNKVEAQKYYKKPGVKKLVKNMKISYVGNKPFNKGRKVVRKRRSNDFGMPNWW